jgi:hypothetical protein
MVRVGTVFQTFWFETESAIANSLPAERPGMKKEWFAWIVTRVVEGVRRG